MAIENKERPRGRYNFVAEPIYSREKSFMVGGWKIWKEGGCWIALHLNGELLRVPIAAPSDNITLPEVVSLYALAGLLLQCGYQEDAKDIADAIRIDGEKKNSEAEIAYHWDKWINSGVVFNKAD